MDLVGLSLPLLLVFWQWTTTTGAAGSVGQSKWADYFPDCGGKAQSPVDMATVQTQYDPSLSPLTPLGYSQHGNKPFSLYNNGHTGNYSNHADSITNNIQVTTATMLTPSLTTAIQVTTATMLTPSLTTDIQVTTATMLTPSLTTYR
nr:carbonic anhydrase 14-like isoform X2 [Oncorhynchus nerka]